MGMPGENVSFKDAINDFPNDVKSVEFIPVGKPDLIPIPLHPPEPFTGRVIAAIIDGVYYGAQDFPEEDLSGAVEWRRMLTMSPRSFQSTADDDRIHIVWKTEK